MVREIWHEKRGCRKPLYFNGGDEGSRTPVQNGLKQTSTSVDFILAQLIQEKI